VSGVCAAAEPAAMDAATPIARAIFVVFICTPPQWKCAFDVI
jgi:hypothetical protein